MFFSSYLQGTLKQLSIHAEFGEERVKVKAPPPLSERFKTVLISTEMWYIKFW